MIKPRTNRHKEEEEKGIPSEGSVLARASGRETKIKETMKRREKGKWVWVWVSAIVVAAGAAVAVAVAELGNGVKVRWQWHLHEKHEAENGGSC